MFKYRKKPVEIEAFQYLGNLMDDAEHGYYVPKWAKEGYKNNTLFYDSGNLFVKTLEGNHKVSIGDYIIKGIKNELYPCKPDIFIKTYNKI